MKMFMAKISWYNTKSDPNNGIDKVLIASENYAAAAIQIAEQYQEELMGFYIEEVDNPFDCSVTEEIDGLFDRVTI